MHIFKPRCAWEDGHWLLAANPILNFSFASRDFGQGPEFELCVMAKRKLGPIALGLEYYAGLGPIRRPLPWSDEDEYVYETIDLISLPRVEVNFGVGEGLSVASSDLVAKLNLGYVWDPLTDR